MGQARLKMLSLLGQPVWGLIGTTMSSVGAFESPCCSVSVRRVAGASPNSSCQRAWEAGSRRGSELMAAGAPRKHGGSSSALVLGLVLGDSHPRIPVLLPKTQKLTYVCFS